MSLLVLCGMLRVGFAISKSASAAHRGQDNREAAINRRALDSLCEDISMAAKPK